MKEHRFVFVCGLHRSGTSILFKNLREHPEISGFRNTGAPEEEGQHLQTVFAPAKKYGGAGRFGFHGDACLDETSDLVTEENGKKLFREWGRHWDLEKSHLLEKSPPNLLRTRFLQALFPASCFIIITRHPLAVTFAERKYKRDLSPEHLLEHWLVCHERFERDRGRVKRVHVVKYEDFVAAPAATMKSLFSFIGVGEIAIAREVLPGVNEKYFSQWRSYRRSLLTRWQARRLVKSFQSRVRRFGYDLERVDDLRPYP